MPKILNSPLPLVKPKNPKFAVGPTSKRPNYKLDNISDELLGRNHRVHKVNILLQTLVQKTKNLLKIPPTYKIIMTPGSDTGAMEMALWNLIGTRNTECLVWDAFGYLWADDLENQLKIKNLIIHKAPYGEYPDVSSVNFKDNDIVFTHCGTTSGVIFKHEHLIPEERHGLIISDATSFILSEDIPWSKIDVLTFSWQKYLGGEAQNGMLVLSPRAIERINSYTPVWAIPQLFRIKAEGKIRADLLDTGSPINTISILCCLDYLDALNWIEEKGGASYAKKIIATNFNVLRVWVEQSSWIAFSPFDVSYSSKLSVCLKIVAQSFLSKGLEEQNRCLNNLYNYLEENKVAYDIRPYRKAPLGIRIWCGVTIDAEDLSILTQWLDWGFEEFLQ